MSVIGGPVVKKSGKPFKSGLKVNTIKGLVCHPINDEPAYTFHEDNSFVSVAQCLTHFRTSEAVEKWNSRKD